MGIKGKGSKKAAERFTATEFCAGGVESGPRQAGVRLILKFMGRAKPELDRAEFHCYPGAPKVAYIKQRDRDFSFTWTQVPRAMSLLFLEYACAGLDGREKDFSFPGQRRGSLAASLSDAIAKNSGRVYDLFTEYGTDGIPHSRVKQIFDGKNLEGKEDNERRIEIKSDYLAADCVEVFWEGKQLRKRDEIWDLSQLIRKAWKLEASRQPEPPKPAATPAESGRGEGEANPRQTENAAASKKPGPADPPPRESKAAQSAAESSPGSKEAPQPQAEAFNAAEWMAREFSHTLDALLGAAGGKSASGDSPKGAQKPPENTIPQPRPEQPPPPPIPKELFVVQPTDGYWPDEMPLVEFSDEGATHHWTLRNAFEGVLILGRTGGGKTSGSGVTFAESFLRTGFGGLVLTVKEGEAEHWRRLCRLCGRENDLVVVSRGGDWKFNVLAYEAQHPGRGGRLSENFTALCKNLLRISVRNKGGGTNEQIWETAADQLLNATFDLFLLAGGELSFDRLADFISAAPTETLPATEAEWLQLPVFGSVFLKARKSLAHPEDQRIFRKATDYWFNYYRTRPPKMRASIILSISAMLDAFRGRDIPALISSETSVTPEMIMSGKIVLLDLPLKEYLHTGLMVQSIWKYCFQTAIERQKRANDPRRRPVFLWEDEGQYFFSDHDQRFQDTARSSRVCRVILTQNLHSFYKEFGQGGQHAADTVFGNLNTKVFHNNSDPLTNQWTADHLGKELQTKVTISRNPPQPKPPPLSNLVSALPDAWNPPSTTGVSTTEGWEYAVQPGEFNKLRTGGRENDFLVDAYITWMGLLTDDDRHFIRITFQQNPEL